MTDQVSKTLPTYTATKDELLFLETSSNRTIMPTTATSQFSNNSFIYDEKGSLFINRRGETFTPPEPALSDPPLLLASTRSQTLNTASLPPLSISCRENVIIEPTCSDIFSRNHVTRVIYNPPSATCKQGPPVLYKGPCCDSTLTVANESRDSRRESKV